MMVNIQEGHASKKDLSRLKWQVVLVISTWTVLLISLLAWSINNINDEMLGLARLEAIANFNKDQAFRSWATIHGGVYVPETERTQPSPYLSHIPERDLTTPSGRKLTLLNPAFMLRQLMEDFDELYGVKGRITSLQPLNPNNLPDEWERAALLAFEDGEQEVFEVTEINGQPFLRLIRPMLTTEGCLKCHAFQGYQVGDVRGGVGVAVPLDKYLSVASGRKQRLLAISGVIWLVGMGFIWVGGSRSRQRILERIEYEKNIWHQANFDSLTGLANRELFMDRLDRALAYAKRDSHKLALIFIDLDRFKDVNDTCGHAVGDKLLEQAARRLEQSVRHMDSVSRLGGDEFTVVLPEVNDEASAAVAAKHILGQFSAPFEIDGHTNYLSASIGITIFPNDGTSSGELLQNADVAMYQAKLNGRDTYCYFTAEMTQRAERRVNLESELHQALKNREFELYYQPIFSMNDHVLAGAEALIRWNSASRGQVPPDEFISVAEDSGLIVPIGKWALEQSVKDMAMLDRSDLPLQWLSVNISTMQFRDKEFAVQLTDFLRSHPHMHQRLSLEITESVFMDEHGDPARQLKILQENDIRISIDDFGTGYSALGYLKRFPVNSIKIDRSFVHDISTDTEHASLCEAIIALAHNLNLQVIAEGVETDEQWHFLQQNRCDYAQGYLMGKPMSLSDFIQFAR
ncbi:MAG: EAL domain-containing protein [Sedimenticola sp.]